MKKQKIVVMGLLCLSCSVYAKTIQVGGEQNNQQEKSNPCWTASLQPIIFVNGSKQGLQPDRSVVLGLTGATEGVVCSPCDSADKTLTEPEKPVEQSENDKPVMVWYKDPKTNKKIIVNGKYNDLDDEGNLKWDNIHARKEDCQQRLYLELNGRCGCATSFGIYLPVDSGNIH